MPIKHEFITFGFPLLTLTLPKLTIVNLRKCFETFFDRGPVKLFCGNFNFQFNFFVKVQFDRGITGAYPHNHKAVLFNHLMIVKAPF